MSYTLRIVARPTYLHALVTGTNSAENVAGYLDDIRRECAARNCHRVLIQEDLKGPRLDMMSVFEIASAGSSRAGAAFKAIAYVDVNAEGDLMKFAETVAVNRGLRVAVFPTVSEAERWLQARDLQAGEQQT